MTATMELAPVSKVSTNMEETIQKMLICDAHIGAENIQPKMVKYVYQRTPQGNHLFNPVHIWEKLMAAARIIVCEEPNNVCAVASRVYAARPAMKFAHYVRGTSVAGKWTPGMLTNQITEKFHEPRILIVADPQADFQAIKESSMANIMVIGFCNTDADLSHVDFAIPCNNRGPQSIGLMFWLLAREVLYLRGDLSRTEEWDVMPDLFFYKDPSELDATVEEAEGAEGEGAEGEAAEGENAGAANAQWENPTDQALWA